MLVSSSTFFSPIVPSQKFNYLESSIRKTQVLAVFIAQLDQI